MSENNVSEVENKENEKENKLKNQSEELNYLTNVIIPNLKKENEELKSLKIELTDALEKSTKKYYSQLDINADLSDNLAKTGAEFAVAKVRMDKLESESDAVKEKYEAKIKELEDKLKDSEDITKIKDDNEKLSDQLKEKTAEILKLEETVPKLKSEIDDLRKNLIEIGDYKEKVDSEAKNTINRFKIKINSLEDELKKKQSSY